MTPRLTCSVCNADLQKGGRFCGNCGTRIEGELSRELPAREETDSFQCSLCGNVNPPGTVYCDACGATMAPQAASRHTPRLQTPKQRKPQAPEHSRKTQVLGLLQSWKVTVGLGVVFLGVLVVVALSRNPNDPFGENKTPVPRISSPETGPALREIEQLQKVVDANPNDMDATLQLANRLHDIKFFPRALTLYQRYLKVNPANVDARVDLGICYFELGLADSSRRPEYMREARREMEKALTENPKHQLAYFNLGIVSLHSGSIEEANTLFKKCFDLNPNSETGKRAQQLYSQHQFNTLTR